MSPLLTSVTPKQQCKLEEGLKVLFYVRAVERVAYIISDSYRRLLDQILGMEVEHRIRKSNINTTKKLNYNNIQYQPELHA